MLSQTADYALRAVVALACRGDRPVTARQLAEATGIPASYLAKVLHGLVRSGLVRSSRGTSGGFGLADPPEGVSVLDVVNAVEPNRRSPGRLSARPDCPCGLHRRIDAGLSMAEALFASSTIAELVGDRD